MAKYYGAIGYATTAEDSNRPGIWKESIVEHNYYGDVIRDTRRLSGSEVNDSITISNQISVVTDPYAFSNFHSIRYITFMGTKWKVTDIEVRRPRLILTIGGEYND